jgi:hypothetical protein
MAERIIKIDGEEWLLETDENDNVIKRTKLPPAEEAKSDDSKKTDSKKTEDSEETESKAKAFGKKLRKPLAIAGGVLAGIVAYGAGKKAGKDSADATLWSNGYKAAVKDSGNSSDTNEGVGTDANESEALE